MKIKKAICIMLVIIWMSAMFWFSNQQGTGSSSTSKKVSEIIVNIIDINKQYTDVEKEEIIEVIEPIIRKLAHYMFYAIGGILIANCVYQFCDKEKSVIAISAVIGILYATSDEIHQLMVPGRSGNIKDVIIDSIGILTGIAFLLLVREIVKELLEAKSKTKEVE